MLATILQRILQQLILLVVVSVVLLAAYVSAGRQFMPAVSAYAEFLEQQILENSGIPVQIDSLTGSFSGFNPVISIDGLRLAVAADSHPDEVASSALYFDSAMLIVDMPRSVWQRRWVLEEFIVESLELDLQQNATGGWQLSGVDVSGEEPINLDTLYQTFLSFNRLDLRNVVINVNTMSGDSFIFTNGLATIQNQGDDHFLHINANLERNPQQLAFSMEVQGDQLTELDGKIHVAIPEADYSSLFTALNLADVEIQQLEGIADLWIDFADGEVDSAQSEFSLSNLTIELDEGSPLAFQDFSGKSALSRGLARDHWEVALSDMAINYGAEFWRDFNAFVHFVPDQLFTARADLIEVSLLADLAMDSGLLDAAALEQLAGYSPAGALENFTLSIPLGSQQQEPIRSRANLADVEVGSVRGSPNMWGLTGFLELEVDRQAGLVSGVAEVESENFSMNIPNTFTRVWDFDYVNGRLNIEVDSTDGERVSLLSSIVMAESPAVDGRVQFASLVHRHPDGSRDASLDLMVGAQRVDAEYKSLFLPDGSSVQPNLRNSMEFLEQAILDGDVLDSGVIFRGNTIEGSEPVTKTFQSFFVLENGELNYSDDWPDLGAVSGLVVTDDNNIDIQVSGGSSLGINLERASGRIRRNELDENWLTVTGVASASTTLGLDYLQQIPVDDGLKETFSNWAVAGDFNADIDVLIPLSEPGAEPDVRLNILIEDNELAIPDYDLAVSDLTGPVIFDTRTGLEPSALSAQLFGDQVSVQLSSEFDNGSLQRIFIGGTGTTTPAELIGWPGQSDFVRDLLAHMSGSFDYEALMTIDQTGEAAARNSLSIESGLQGAALNLPQPIGKSAAESMALSLQLDFGDNALAIDGSLGDQLQMNLGIENGSINSGILTLGQDMPDAEILSSGADSGLVILGDMQRFELQAWTDFVASLGAAGESSSAYGDNIAFVDIATDVFSLYDQDLPTVNFRIEPENTRQGWLASLSSESIQGDVLIPYDNQEYLQVDLDYLILPSDEEDAAGNVLQDEAQVAIETVVEEEPEEQIDPLLNLDPRGLPLMEFATDAFAIGDRQYGSWEFTLIPTNAGAEFYDLNFDFRGLRLGRDEPSEGIEPLDSHFRWNFDGESHSSELVGVLVANDIGEVLAANGYAPSLQSNRATFVTEVSWPGSPAFFSSDHLSGRIDLLVEEGRFNRNSGGQGALRLVSFINLTAIFQRLRFSDDLLRRGLAYDEISGKFSLDDGRMHIEDRLLITGPSSLYQITGDLDLANEVIEGEMYVTLPVSNNLPWIGLLTANIPLAVGAYLFDQIFGDQVDSLSSAVYTLSGPLAGLEPRFKQAFGSPDSPDPAQPAPLQ